MSILSNLIDSLSGDSAGETVERPCNNFESSCKVCPNACEECKPYKQQLVDALYNVEHLEEFRARYEVVSNTAVSVGSITCPYCGGPSSSPAVCDYCGMQLSAASGKIQVASANDIPNPVLEAQNLIFDRRKVISKYDGTQDANISSGGLLSSFVSALTGSGDSDEDSVLGKKMTENEIEAMANQYGVSVADYLEGLDMGSYYTKSVWGTRRKYSYNQTSTGTGFGTAAVLGTAGAYAVSGHNNMNMAGHNPPPRPPQQGGYMYGQRPPQQGFNNGRPPQQNAYGGQRPPQQSYGSSRPAQTNTGRPQQPAANRPQQANTNRPQQSSAGRPQQNTAGRPAQKTPGTAQHSAPNKPQAGKTTSASRPSPKTPGPGRNSK